MRQNVTNFLHWSWRLTGQRHSATIHAVQPCLADINVLVKMECAVVISFIPLVPRNAAKYLFVGIFAGSPAPKPVPLANRCVRINAAIENAKTDVESHALLARNHAPGNASILNAR